MHNHPLFGTVWADIAELPPILDQSSALGGGTLALVDEYEGPVNDAGSARRAVEQMGDASMALLAGHGVFVLGGSARAVHQRAVALEQRCQHAWYARAAGGSAVSRVPQAFIDLVSQSNGEGFIGFWEAAVRAELAADPDLLQPVAAGCARPEDLAQLERDGRLELGVGARRRVAVGPPAHERGGMAEAVVLEVVVGDLAHRLGPDRLPRHVLARVPAVDGTGRPALGLGLCPARPRVSLQGVLAIGRELVDELAAPGHAEPGRHTDVVQGPRGVEEAEQQGTDAGTVLVRAEAGHHTVGRALVLDLEHRRACRAGRRGRPPWRPRRRGPAPSKRANQSAATSGSWVDRGEVHRRAHLLEQFLERGAAPWRTGSPGTRCRRAPAGRRPRRMPGSTRPAGGCASRPDGCAGTSASKSSPLGPATTISPSSTQRAGSSRASAATSSGK